MGSQKPMDTYICITAPEGMTQGTSLKGGGVGKDFKSLNTRKSSVKQSFLHKKDGNDDNINRYASNVKWGKFHGVPALDKELQATNTC